jgi:hypothetical protein
MAAGLERPAPLMENVFADGPVGALSGGETGRLCIIFPTTSSSIERLGLLLSRSS